MSIASHYHAHKPNVPIIQEDVFQWAREGNTIQLRVWLDDSEHDLNIGDDHAFSLLHWACKEGHLTIVDLLLSRGARINATNMGDDTPLHLASGEGHREIVGRLLLKRAEVNGGNEHGCTPLHYACFNGYDTVATDLIAAGAQVMLCNKRGLTSIDVCQPAIRQAVIEYAINHNQNLNQKIPYRDQNWMGTKTRAREATLSRYTGVDLQSLQLSKEIAKSHSGALYRGRWQDTEIVARVLNISEVTSRISRDFQTEFPALRIFACVNISPVLAAVNHPPRLIVISQFMRLGSLYNVLHEQSVDVIIDHSQSIRFALDIARGMSFLHSMDPMVLRYYLSSKHVVVDDDLSAKISMADTKFSFQEVGRLYSPGWMSPEALQRSPEQSNVRASDMWSFGIVLWELSTREVPFADLSPMEAGMKIALEGLRVQIPPGISRSLFRLINICLNEDPGRRPNFDQIIPILEKMA